MITKLITLTTVLINLAWPTITVIDALFDVPIVPAAISTVLTANVIANLVIFWTNRSRIAIALAGSCAVLLSAEVIWHGNMPETMGELFGPLLLVVLTPSTVFLIYNLHAQLKAAGASQDG